MGEEAVHFVAKRAGLRGQFGGGVEHLLRSGAGRRDARSNAGNVARDVAGSGGFDPRPGNDTVEFGMSGGDITMACAAPAGGYDWEGTGNCPNHATYANDGHEPGGVVEYFPGDFFDPYGSGQGSHQEASQGSVAYIPQQQWVISTELDPAQRANAGGVGYYDVNTGIGPGQDAPAHGYEFVSPNDTGFAKAGGLGDIAYDAANAPIQIGNIVWFDGDHNGIQDPYSTDEVPLAGATVRLLKADGEQVAVTETDAAGEYYFGGAGASYQLTPGAKYTVQFDVCTANTSNVPGQPPTANLRFTLPAAGNNRAHDSNVTPPTTGPLCDGNAPVTAPANPGGVDHTIDAGVYIPQAPPPPTSTPPPSTSAPSPSTSAPVPPAQMPPKPAPSKPTGGALAPTGATALPALIAVAVLLIVAGSTFAIVSRKRRRANQR